MGEDRIPSVFELALLGGLFDTVELAFNHDYNLV